LSWHYLKSAAGARPAETVQNGILAGPAARAKPAKLRKKHCPISFRAGDRPRPESWPVFDVDAKP